jgi:hypothetical protein
MASAIGTDARGNLLVIWPEKRPGSDWIITGRRLDSTGVAGEQFTVTRKPMREMGGPALAMNAAGQAVAVWVRMEPDGLRRTLVARRFRGDGTAVDDAEQELETERCLLASPVTLVLQLTHEATSSCHGRIASRGVGNSPSVRRYGSGPSATGRALSAGL